MRLSLLVSLGLLSSACGGTTTEPQDKGGDGGHEGGGGAGGGTGPIVKPTGPALGQCTSPSVDPKTHLVTCEEGYAHRPEAVRCDGAPNSTDTAAPFMPAGCEDCGTLPNGYCVFGGQPAHCVSGCVEDADCAAGSVCSCTSSQSPTGGECVPTDCTTDDDCGTGLCAATHQLCGEARFACQSKTDECQTDDDCELGYCSYGESPYRTCFSGACGRPFLVAATPRLPPVTARTDWQSGAGTPCVDHLTRAERHALAEHWTKMGQMEHASIAAFARFSLQLLSLGAPPELVEACTAALADETAHTKLCFGIASAYAGRAIGPGPLDITGGLDVTSLADIVDLVLAEGCFGETSAALQALEAADCAADPVIRAAYSQIAVDEQRHAELAFRFVRWALEREPAVVAKRIESALAEGRISASVRDVAAPCLTALLATRLVA